MKILMDLVRKHCRAITESFGLACRYPDEHNNVLIDKLAKLNNVDHSQILLGDGSGEILKKLWRGNIYRVSKR